MSTTGRAGCRKHRRGHRSRRGSATNSSTVAVPAELATRFADDVVNLGTTVLNVVFQTFTVLLFTFYLVAEGPQATTGRLLVPRTESPARGARSVGPRHREDRRLHLLAEHSRRVVSGGALRRIHDSQCSFSRAVGDLGGGDEQFIPVIGTYFAGALPLLITVVDDPRTAILGVLIVDCPPTSSSRTTSSRREGHRPDHGDPRGGGIRFCAGRWCAPRGGRRAAWRCRSRRPTQAFVSGYRQHLEVEEDALARERPDAEDRRLTARLFPPIVCSGACHCLALGRNPDQVRCALS